MKPVGIALLGFLCASAVAAQEADWYREFTKFKDDAFKEDEKGKWKKVEWTSMEKALEKAGYTIDEAADGNAAREKIRARRYLVVITDLKLPGASGIEVLREVRQADATIPVILMTAYGSVDEAVTAMKKYLKKSVNGSRAMRP
jgi:CheY-like chemotaxis protein